MSNSTTEVRAVQVDPIDCLKQSFTLIGSSYWLMLGITFVGMIIASAVPFGILMGPMMCGIYLCYFELMRKKPFEFALLFKGFDHFIPSLIASLILTGISLVVIVPFYIVFFVGFIAAAASGGQPAFPLAMMGVIYPVVIILMMILALFFMFAFPLIADRKLGAVDALKTSFRAACANFGGLLVLMILSGLIGMAGFCLCCIGMVFAMPVQFGAFAIAYRKIFADNVDLPPPVPGQNA